MLRVALTGGLGSGKTTAAEIFRDLGCFVSQSDEVARSMMQPGEAVYRAIVQEFGPAVVEPEGRLDRQALATLAFSQDRLEALNAIVHPAVIAWQNRWMQDVGNEHPDAIAMVESALVFETRYSGEDGQAAGAGAAPWRSRFDRVVLVTAPQHVRVSRYADRYLAHAASSTPLDRKAVEDDARARIRRQMPDTEKAGLSDAVIHNAGSREDLRQRVTEVWQQLRHDAAA